MITTIAPHPRSAFSRISRTSSSSTSEQRQPVRDYGSCYPNFLVKKRQLPWDIQEQEEDQQSHQHQHQKQSSSSDCTQVSNKRRRMNGNRKRVSFPEHDNDDDHDDDHDVSKMTTVVHVHSYSEQDLINAWYSSQEYGQFKKDCRNTIIAFANYAAISTTMDDITSRFSTRGLEDHIVPSMNAMKRSKRKQFIQLILRQQELSRWNNNVGGGGGRRRSTTTTISTTDPERLRFLSETYSRDSRELGLTLGNMDSAYLTTTSTTSNQNESETQWYKCV